MDSSPLTILVIHNHYQQRGGEDSVFETECAMLRGAGHTVICYEKHNDEIGTEKIATKGHKEPQKNDIGLNTELQRHRGASRESDTAFPTPKRNPFRAFLCFSWLKKISLFCKTIWNRTTYREITEIIQREKPDIVHCHNTFPLISPSVYWAAARQGVPVVQTLHNYRLICINPYLYRNGKICEDCIGRSPIPGIIRRCYRGSFAASLTVAAMLMIHRLLGTYRNKATTYIALTEFGRQKFIEARLCSPDKVVVKPNAIAAPSASESTDLSQSERGLGQSPSGNYALRTTHYALTDGPPTVLYAGRLSPEKGVDVLIRAWALCHDQLPLGAQLHIIGDGPERQNLESIATEIPSISFLGLQPQLAVRQHMAQASLLVFPSVWYETFGLTILEAAALGTPSIVSDIGGQSSLVEDGLSGYKFISGDAESLAKTIFEALVDSDQLELMARKAENQLLTSDCNPEKNLIALCQIYRNLCYTSP